MSLRVHLLVPQIHAQFLKFHSYPILSMTHHLIQSPSKPQISCTSNSSGNAELASDIAMKIEKTQVVQQREEAMKKSKQLLFTELCNYLGLRTEDMMKKWRNMEEEDKWVLVKGFVSEWGVNFHPLSVRSVKEMVEEHLVEDNLASQSSSVSLLPGWKKIIGFPLD